MENFARGELWPLTGFQDFLENSITDVHQSVRRPGQMSLCGIK